MSRYLLAVVLVCGSVVCAADLGERWSKRVADADAWYDTAVKKAQQDEFYGMQKLHGERRKANAIRVTAMQQLLREATKAGDFDAATAIKTRIDDAAQVGLPRSKPKHPTKFGGHEYAIIPEQVTWHVAKRICEEMGGHLATVNSAAENEALLAMCKASGSEPWTGATDEINEGHWRWVDGTPFSIEMHQDNAGEIQHYMIFHAGLDTWDDGDGGARHPFVCEWN